MWRVARVGAVALVLMVVSTACGGGEADEAAEAGAPRAASVEEKAAPRAEGQDASESDGTPTASPDETAAAADAEQEVLDAWDAAKEALNAAYDPPDPDDPDLLATRAGESLDTQQASLRDLQARGVSWVTTSSEWSREVKSLDGDTAVVEACGQDHTREVETQSGEELATDDPIFDVEHTMERIDGAWKVTETEGERRDTPCTVD